MPNLQNFKKFKFKSVGVDKKETLDLQDTIVKKLDTPIGIRTPIQFGTDVDGLCKMHHNNADQVADNLRNLILTNHGERLGLHNFGANLRELTFELGNSDVDSEAMSRISKAASIFMPYVQLREFIPTIDRNDDFGIAQKRISVIYDIPNIGVFNKRIDVILYEVG